MSIRDITVTKRRQSQKVTWCTVSFIWHSFKTFLLLKKFFSHAGSWLLLWLLSSCGKRGLLSSCDVQASHCSDFCRAQAPGYTASVVVVHGLSCSVACGILLDQGLKARPLHWRADSFFFFFNIFIIYLAALALSCKHMGLVPWPGIEPRPSALGVWSLSHCTTREIPWQADS